MLDICINGRRSVTEKMTIEFIFLLYLLHVCAVSAITVGNTNAGQKQVCISASEVLTVCYLHFTVFRAQDNLLYPQNSLWAPVSLWNIKVSQATFGSLKKASKHGDTGEKKNKNHKTLLNYLRLWKEQRILLPQLNWVNKVHLTPTTEHTHTTDLWWDDDKFLEEKHGELSESCDLYSCWNTPVNEEDLHHSVAVHGGDLKTRATTCERVGAKDIRLETAQQNNTPKLSMSKFMLGF